MPKRIQRSRAKGSKLPHNCSSVTRPGPWGNPFVGEHAVDAFVTWLQAGKRKAAQVAAEMNALGFNVELAGKDEKAKERYGRRTAEWINANLHKLRGFDLACFCGLGDGVKCHADVLLVLAAKAVQQTGEQYRAAVAERLIREGSRPPDAHKGGKRKRTK